MSALKMCAEIKYPKDAGAMRKLESKIVEGRGPVTANPVVSKLFKNTSLLCLCVGS